MFVYSGTKTGASSTSQVIGNTPTTDSPTPSVRIQFLRQPRSHDCSIFGNAEWLPFAHIRCFFYQFSLQNMLWCLVMLYLPVLCCFYTNIQLFCLLYRETKQGFGLRWECCYFLYSCLGNPFMQFVFLL